MDRRRLVETVAARQALDSGVERLARYSRRVAARSDLAQPSNRELPTQLPSVAPISDK